MRRLVVALSLGAGLCIVPLAVGAGAVAHIERQAWARTAALPTFVAQSGTVYVAANPSGEEARTFIQVDIDGFDEAVLRHASLLLREGSDTLLPTSASVSACQLRSGFANDGQLEGPSLPVVDCTTRVDADRTDDGRWKVDLAVFASGWIAGPNYGLALVPAETVPTAHVWRIGFSSAHTTLGLPPSSSDEAAPQASAPIATGSSGANRVESSAGGPASRVASTIPPAPVRPSTPSMSIGTSSAGTGLPSTPPERRIPAPAAAFPASRSAGSPPAWIFLGGLLAVFAIGLLGTPLRRRIVVPLPLRGSRARAALLVGAAVGVALLPLAGSEVTIYRAGLVLIFLVGALGLHVLVNWAGQLSLAHAGMVGLPAFLVLALSDVYSVSPILLLPLAAAFGGVVGGVVALPTLRAKGLQVALVTLVAGIAIDRFFFTKRWFVGDSGGRVAAAPTIGPLRFGSDHALYPFLLFVVILTTAAVWALLHSKVARAWFWVRSDPAAAAAFGVSVVGYRILAFVTGGTLAGLAGGLSVMWTQRMTSQSFPTTLSFNYLLAVILAGPGFVGGLAVAVAAISGGPLFLANLGTVVAYMGPVGLIYNVTRYEAGFNGAGRAVMERFRARPHAHDESTHEQVTAEPISLGLIAGTAAVLAGFVAIAIAWYHAGNTDETWRQNQELISGGVGGLALVVVGTGLLIRDRLTRSHMLLIRYLQAVSPHDRDPDRDVATDAEPLVAASVPAMNHRREPATTSAQQAME